jgi:zinc protease
MTLIDTRPVSGPPRDWKFPDYTRTTLDSGLHLVLCHLPGRPLAAARLVLEAGAVSEAAGQAGVATLAARALTEGTTSLDSHALAEALEGLGAEVRGELSWDAMHVRLDVPVGHLAEGLSLLGSIVREPAFNDSDVDRLRNERLDQIAQEKMDPAAVAARAFQRNVFVPDSAYARPMQGSEGTVSALSASSVSEFYRGRIEAGAATLIVAGDLSSVDVAGAASGAFGSWAAAVGDVAPPVIDEAGGGRRIVLVDRPGSVQSALAIGHGGPSRRIADYVATGTMAMVLGGVFGSRLNLKLREEKGYTYGAFAGFDFRRHGGLFNARSAVRTEDTGAAVADAVGEIARTQADGIPESELASVREYRVGIYPIAYERPAAVAYGLADLVVYDLPDGWFDQMRSELAAVSAVDVSASAARHLRPDQMAIVVVGDADKVEADLAATGLGPVSVVDVADVLG